MPTFIRSSQNAGSLRTLDVRADDADARDFIFEPSLDLLPPSVDHRGETPVLDQENEGACVGFALATVINISFHRRHRSASSKRKRKKESVSPGMLYEMGRRYDEWQGENYEGTSPRGGMKGWHKHGVTTAKRWPYRLTKNGEKVIDRELTEDRAKDALRRPIGAYYRIIESDVSHLQAAIVEGDAVLASAWVHPGWEQSNLMSWNKGLKRIRPQTGKVGLHAFAIIGYMPEGFIVQNSWGPGWGSTGYALLAYEDWFENRQDAWVARPGPETRDFNGEPKIYVVDFSGGLEATRVQTASSGLDIDPQVLPYLINTGDRGKLSSDGQLATKKSELPQMARQVLTTPALSDGYRHVVLYAHGGLNSESFSAKTANRLWSVCRQKNLGAYFFIWESGITESVKGWLKSDDDASGPVRFSIKNAWEKIKKGAGDIIHGAQKILGKELAPVVREVFWDEMKDRAKRASTPSGGGALFAGELFQVIASTPRDKYKIHLVGHSAGCIYLGFLYQNVLKNLLQNHYSNVQLASIQLMAPAITVSGATKAFSVNGGWAVSKKEFVVYMLDTKNEDNDNIKIYPSSLLTYVADYLENKKGRVPILGILKDFTAIKFATPVQATKSVRHGEFDEKGHEVEEIINNIAQLKY